MSQIQGSWQRILGAEFRKDYYKDLYRFVKEEYEHTLIFPKAEDIFNALHFTAHEDVKVVILGQDPYHGENQAHGLSFSVPDSQTELPPSLKNIYKELQDDLGIPIASTGNLEKWAKQGVLLLNTVLTVRAHQAFSHRDKGWEQFTDAIIQAVDAIDRPIVFLLWGNPAKAKSKLLKNPNHLILTAAHPSPLAAHRGFFGCRHFSKTNAFLREHGIKEIDWSLSEMGQI